MQELEWIAVTEKDIAAFGDSVSGVETTLKKKGITWGGAMPMKAPRKDEESMSA